MLRTGAPVEITFTFRDHEDRDSKDVDLGPLDLSAVSVLTATLTKPDGSRLEGLALAPVEAAAGTAKLTLTPQQNDTAGVWHAQGFADGFPSDPASWRVGPNL